MGFQSSVLGGLGSVAAMAKSAEKNSSVADALEKKADKLMSPVEKKGEDARDWLKRAENSIDEASNLRKQAKYYRGGFNMEMFAYAQAMAQSQKDTKSEQDKQIRARMGRVI